MATFREKFSNWLHPNNRSFSCDRRRNITTSIVNTTSDTFNSLYKETRELAAEIIAKLEEQRKHVKLLCRALDSASDAIALVDNKGTIVYANSKFVELYNFRIDSLIGSNLAGLHIKTLEGISLTSLWDNITTMNYWEGDCTITVNSGKSVLVVSKILPIIFANEHVATYFIFTQKVVSHD